MSLLATSSTGSTAAPPQTSAALVGAANGAIAWTACGEQLRVREGAGAAELGTPARRQDQARGDPPPRQSARGADRLDVREPGRTRRLRRAGARGGASLDAAGQGRFDVVGGTSAAPATAPTFDAFGARAEGEVLRQLVDSTPGRQSRRIAHKTATLARRCGEVSGRLLRHISAADGPRSRPLAPARRRPKAHLRWHLRRDVHRPDLRQHVSAPGAGNGPRRGRRPRRLHWGTEAGYANQLRFSDRGFEVSCRCARARGRRAAHWRVTVPWRRAWIRCWRSCGAAPSRPRPPIRQAS